MPDMTISDLKRALVEVKRYCEKRGQCIELGHCPFYHDEIGACSLDHSFPEYWDTEDWKEDTDENA